MADSKVQPELVELSDDFPFTGDVSGTVADGSITDVKVSDMAASKLTGALPAISGAALTGLAPTYTNSASDPATNTNPALGTLWVNQVSGETYVCTDATTDANVWYNVGGGTGDVQDFFYKGTTSIYASGIAINGALKKNIESFAIASDGNMTTTGTLSSAQHTTGGGSKSDTYAYIIGGHGDGVPYTGAIQKYSFSSGVQNGSVISLASTYSGAYRAGFSDGSYAYTAGRYTVAGGVEYNTNTIERFNTSTEAAIEDHGDLSLPVSAPGFHSSITHGYTAGGEGIPGGSVWFGHMDKFAFANNVTAASHGTLAPSRGVTGSYNTETTGYVSGGRTHNGGATNEIDKFSFTSNTTTTNCGTLSTHRAYMCGGGTGVDFGYSIGGTPHGGGAGNVDVMEKQQFSNDTTIQNIGTLTAGCLCPAINQI